MTAKGRATHRLRHMKHSINRPRNPLPSRILSWLAGPLAVLVKAVRHRQVAGDRAGIGTTVSHTFSTAARVNCYGSV